MCLYLGDRECDTCMSDVKFFFFGRSEQLLRERMRSTGSGITSYEYIYGEDSIVIHGPQCLVMDRQSVSFLFYSSDQEGIGRWASVEHD